MYLYSLRCQTLLQYCSNQRWKRVLPTLKQFNEAAQIYDIALKTSDYKENIEYQKKAKQNTPEKFCGITPYPCIDKVATNVVKELFHLLSDSAIKRLRIHDSSQILTHSLSTAFSFQQSSLRI